MAKRQPRAFTLVELLVVISIIGMLMALLFPAVNAAIGRAKRAQCMNNQKEISLALTMYENQRERFPGFNEVVGGRIASWVVAIMPQLQRGDLYDTWDDPSGAQVSGTIDLMICPTDAQTTLGGAWCSYVVNSGHLDNSSAPYDYPANGIFHDHRKAIPVTDQVKVSLSYVASHDGTATTLLLSENIRANLWTDFYPEDPVGFFWLHNNTNQTINRADTTTGNLLVSSSLSAAAATRLSSNHPSGVVAAFADGHVAFLSERISAAIYRKLCTPYGAGAAGANNSPDPDPGPPLKDTDFNF